MRVSGLFSYSEVLYENRSSIPFLSKIEVVSPSFMQKFEAERLSRSCRVRKNLFTLEQVAGRKVKNITKTEDHLCFGETCTAFIIADCTGGNAKRFRDSRIRIAARVGSRDISFTSTKNFKSLLTNLYHF